MISDEKKIIGCCIAENITQVNKHGICNLKKKPKFAMFVFSMFPCSFTIIGIACLPVHTSSLLYMYCHLKLNWNAWVVKIANFLCKCSMDTIYYFEYSLGINKNWQNLNGYLVKIVSPLMLLHSRSNFINWYSSFRKNKCFFKWMLIVKENPLCIVGSSSDCRFTVQSRVWFPALVLWLGTRTSFCRNQQNLGS